MINFQDWPQSAPTDQLATKCHYRVKMRISNDILWSLFNPRVTKNYLLSAYTSSWCHVIAPAHGLGLPLISSSNQPYHEGERVIVFGQMSWKLSVAADLEVGKLLPINV